MISEAIQNLASRLPPGWRLTAPTLDRLAGPSPDAVVELIAPDGTARTWLLEVKTRVEPKDVSSLVGRLRRYRSQNRPDWSRATRVIVTSFLSPRTRERLEEFGLNYVDLAGNVRLVADRPGLFIYDRCVDRNPWREKRPARSLKGAKAGRIVRALCDFFPPLGIRTLAEKAGTDAGYVSRTLVLLDREDLIKRMPRGPVTDVDWKGLIRRWAQDSSPFDSRRVGLYLEPRGASALLQKFRKADLQYAVTGSFAASRVAPVAPPRLMICYVNDRERAAQYLDLRRTETGANVLLASPRDAIVYERTWRKEGITFAALSQVAADLLGSPGRGPAEVDALMKWMADNDSVWRRRS